MQNPLPGNDDLFLSPPTDDQSIQPLSLSLNGPNPINDNENLLAAGGAAAAANSPPNPNEEEIENLFA